MKGEVPQLERPNDDTPPDDRLDGVVVGVLLGLSDSEQPIVFYPGCPSTTGIRARATAALCVDDVGMQVALIFEKGDSYRPIVLGRMRHQRDLQVRSIPVAVEIDGKSLVFEAKEQIVFRCGQASIHLTKAGKVLIKGAYVSTRSSGANRIKGASVLIN